MRARDDLTHDFAVTVRVRGRMVPDLELEEVVDILNFKLDEQTTLRAGIDVDPSALEVSTVTLEHGRTGPLTRGAGR